MSVAAQGPGAPRTPSEDRRHTEHGRERKQQLVDAAAELFAANGYSATRIQDICRRAGVAKDQQFHGAVESGTIPAMVRALHAFPPSLLLRMQLG